ncbi:hypothetical protein [Kribbella solani]|uniref:hypothetical protein n=1 Tax=Kribbella solani TaxID=236067 RepID=UPI0029BAC882|nr:hypothetical protein [Kribbella solani]MDX2971108.1 hypothetical protein [Kribbella solani]
MRTSDGFVVIDVADAACTPYDLGESEAESLAAELNAMVAAGHQIDAVRWVLPQQVRAAIWQPAGTIDVWLFDKQSDQWVARLRDDSGHVEWCPGSNLRPEPVDEHPRQAADRRAS